MPSLFWLCQFIVTCSFQYVTIGVIVIVVIVGGGGSGGSGGGLKGNL